MDLDPVGTAMGWIASYGAFGLLVVSLSERFVPVMPSYGLLVAVGIAAAEGKWSLPEALLVSIVGSVGGCILFYALVKALGEERSRKLVHASGRIVGVKPMTVENWLARIDRNQAALAFTTQLIPTVRLMAPGIAGLARLDPRTFFIAAGAGVALWNGIFVGIGFVGARMGNELNASLLALGMLLVLVAVEGAVFVILGLMRSRRSQAATAIVEASRLADIPDGRVFTAASPTGTPPALLLSNRRMPKP